MTKFEIFIFGCVNFAILMAIIVWSLRKVARQFLYARRANLKKQMVSAAYQRRQARARLIKGRARASALEEDIAGRRRVMAESAGAESDEITERARAQASRIIDAAARQIEDERAQAAAGVRRQMLEAAFAMAEELVRRGMDEVARSLAVNRGLEELEGAIAKGESGHGGSG